MNYPANRKSPINAKKLASNCLTFNDGSKPRIGIKKGTKHKAEYQKENQLLMSQALNRALKGQTGPLDKKIFKGLTEAQTWSVLSHWMKYILPQSVELAAQVGIQKIEVRYAELPNPNVDAIEDKKLDDYKLLND